ncbi:hypothetical protein C8Q80DRAFT_1273358 [Daedaleopsis nitida]|nr:hypothetical protein C8Q80DRAFT_1273358 [Daedaleopsis nitida]
MPVPDGFTTSKPLPSRTKAKAQLYAPKFASAFDDPRRSKLTSMASPLRPPRPVAQVLSVQQAGPSKQSPLRPIRPPIPPPPAESPQAGPSKQQGSRTAPMRPMKPPSFESPSKPGTKFTLQNDHSSPRNSTRVGTKPVSKASIQHFQPPLPPIPEPAKAARSINALQPLLPLRNGHLPSDANKLKTISTTRLAVAMDPRTENGTDELLALHLEQNAPTYVPPVERELNRGLFQSPEKASKAKSTKFIRGGLAERAQHIFSKQNTAQTLWYKDIALQGERPQAHARVAADLCLRIVTVLHTTSIASLQRSQNVPRLCIVRCAKIIKGRAAGELTVLLDFGRPGSLSEKAHTLDEVKEGREIHLWRPWNSSQADAETMRRHGAPPRDDSTLFCSRFRIASS